MVGDTIAATLMLLWAGDTSGGGRRLPFAVGEGVLSVGEVWNPEVGGLRMPIPDAVDVSAKASQSVDRSIGPRGQRLTFAVGARVVGRVAVLRRWRVEHGCQGQLLGHRSMLVHRGLGCRRTTKSRSLFRFQLVVPSAINRVRGRVRETTRWEETAQPLGSLDVEVGAGAEGSRQVARCCRVPRGRGVPTSREAGIGEPDRLSCKAEYGTAIVP